MANYIGTALLALALGGCAAGPAVPEFGQPLVGAPIVEPTHSVEQADARLADVARRRAAVEDTFAKREQVCYARFFVNRCLDKAKEARRGALSELRAIEAEANHFKRADSVARRDQSLAETQRAAALDAAARAAAPPKPLPVPAEPRAPAAGKSLAERQAEYELKTQRQAARDSAEAGKRAANAARFEARQRDAAERQRRVAAKQAEKEEKARQRAAEKAAADADAAAKAAAADKK